MIGANGDPSSMIAAITGANGFIGRHLVHRFAEAGWATRPVIRVDYEADKLARLFSDADVVVHAAGATRAPTHQRLHAANVELTKRTLDAARNSHAGRFVYISSQAAVGPAPSRDAPVDETTPPAPVEEYGRTKLAAERVVRDSTGIPTTIVRPAAVYGPHDRDFLALFRLAARGVAIHPGNRNQWISIIHVADLVDGVFRAATDTRAVGRTFFLANDEPVQWGELFRGVAACAGRTLAIDLEIPEALVDAGASLGALASRLTGHAALLTTDKVALSKPLFWICSSARARVALNFLPKLNLRDGLCETYHWYRENHWL
jgi:nucleoside-diphosphate-sugar epimerase